MLNNFKLFFLYYFLSLDQITLQFIYSYSTFYIEASLEYFILETVNWVENDANLIFYWIIFIILMSLCVRNEYGHDIEDLHYIMFSLTMGYLVYLHKEFYPRKTKFIFFKYLGLSVILIKLFWSLLLYLWPYTYWLPSFSEVITMILFIWPIISSVRIFIFKNPILSIFSSFSFIFIYYLHLIR